MPIKQVDPHSGGIRYKQTPREKEQRQQAKAMKSLVRDIAVLKASANRATPLAVAPPSNTEELRQEVKSLKKLVRALMSEGLSKAAHARVMESLGEDTLDYLADE